MESENLAYFLKTRRMKLGLSQNDVAEKLGYASAQFVSNWERGLSQPPAKKVEQVAKIYKVSKEKIVDLLLQEKRLKFL